ncbi:MAG TPA: M48 family metallopeptidase [Candidatus Elarobacter sp.]|nr:M48 family metallopeptidase [Candidatus Elarobacter sp.]
MTDQLPVAAPFRRRVFTGIAPIAWEHPADRAALQTLRAIPGLDDVTRKVMSFLGERGVRQLFTADAVRVSARQRPKLNALYDEVLATLDCPERPELFVTQTPFANAMAVGFEHPFIVVHTGALGLLDEPQQRVLLGHEVGHVMSGHATYTTLAMLFINLGIGNIPGLGLLAIPVQLALLEWYRKSEFSADRAGLLASQEPLEAMRMYLRFAGGTGGDDEINLDEFLVQAAEYETNGSALDAIFKVLNVASRTHPFNTVRAAELQRWVRGGEYDRIVAGDYPHRGSDEAKRPLRDDYSDAAGYYGDKVRGVMNSVSDAARRASERFGGPGRGGS